MTTAAPTTASIPPAEETVRIVITESTEAVYIVKKSWLESLGIPTESTQLEADSDLVVGLTEDFVPDQFAVRERAATVGQN